jgi:hypothetical protein
MLLNKKQPANTTMHLKKYLLKLTNVENSKVHKTWLITQKTLKIIEAKSKNHPFASSVDFHQYF